MSAETTVGKQRLNGSRTAENYIDECVLRKCSEPEILYRLLLNFKHDDEALKGFAERLHEWMTRRESN